MNMKASHLDVGQAKVFPVPQSESHVTCSMISILSYLAYPIRILLLYWISILSQTGGVVVGGVEMQCMKFNWIIFVRLVT